MTVPLVGVLGGFDAALAEAAVAAGVELRFIDAANQTRGIAVATWLSHALSPSLLRGVANTVPILPSLAALEASRDRLLEKQLFKSLGILTAPFAGVESAKGIKAATAKFGLPALLKPRIKGGAAVPITAETNLQQAWEAAGPHAVVEAQVELVRTFELSAVRGADGTTGFWPLPEASLEIQKTARGCVNRIMEALSLVGVMRLEFFEARGGLLAHSFSAGSKGWHQPHALENHLRAVAGLPLVPCE